MDCFGICESSTSVGAIQANNNLIHGAMMDSCDDCVGGATGLEANYAKDCRGMCDGEAYEDDCGVCDDNSENDNADDQGCGCFEATAMAYYPDNDADGWGYGSSVEFCTDPGEGWSVNDDDVNDFIECETNLIDDCDVCNGFNACNVPTINDQAIEAQENTSIEFILDASDPNEQDLTAEVLFHPQHGIISSISALSVIYIPVSGYVGEDYFSYIVYKVTSPTSEYKESTL
jgi:hypothetical protein